MDKETEALGQIVLVKQSATNQFLYVLLTHLRRNVPDFHFEEFAELIYAYQEYIPAPENTGDEALDFQARQGLAEWRTLTEMVEKVANQ